jgi:hypothetical protein
MDQKLGQITQTFVPVCAVPSVFFISEAWGPFPVMYGTLSCVAPWLWGNVQHVIGCETASKSWLSWLFFSNDSPACTPCWHRRLLGQIPILNQQMFLDLLHLVHQRATLHRSTRAPPGYQYQGVDACPLGTEERIS